MRLTLLSCSLRGHGLVLRVGREDGTGLKPEHAIPHVLPYLDKINANQVFSAESAPIRDRLSTDIDFMKVG
jgi:hypothetical protein